LVHRVYSCTLPRENAQEPHQILLVQQTEPEPHQRLVQLNRSGIEIGGIRVGFLRADVVIHPEQIGLLIGEAQSIEPVDALFFPDESPALQLLVGAEVAHDEVLLVARFLQPYACVAHLPLLHGKLPARLNLQLVRVVDGRRRNQEHRDQRERWIADGFEVGLRHAFGLRTNSNLNSAVALWSGLSSVLPANDSVGFTLSGSFTTRTSATAGSLPSRAANALMSAIAAR